MRLLGAFKGGVTKLVSIAATRTLCSNSPKIYCGINQARLKHTSSQIKMSEQKRFGQPILTISVDGNISSGKSTLVAKLKDLFPSDFGFDVNLIPEPLEKWTDLKGHNLLGMFYEDTTKHNFMFQHYVQLTRLMETIKKPPPEVSQKQNTERKGTVRIMERSLQNNRYCFTELARREGRLQPAEFAVLSEWHSWMEEHFDLNLDLIIYLRASPETVYNRMQTRGRAEESSVPLDYLKNLHETYEDWLVRGKLGSVSHYSSLPENKGTSEKPKVIVIDANQGKDEVASECSSYIKDFMNDLGHELNISGRRIKN